MSNPGIALLFTFVAVIVIASSAVAQSKDPASSPTDAPLKDSHRRPRISPSVPRARAW